MNNTKLDIWTVYYDTWDFTNLYVVRKFLVNKPTEEFYISKSLMEIRNHIPEGKIYCGRHESDDPKIVEVWI